MIIHTGLRTDIPAFYSDWFFNRISQGYVLSRNPYNQSQIYKYRLDPKVVDCICFCTKNPEPMINRLDEIADFNQFWFVTITSYGKDIERNVPHYSKVIESFKKLSDSCLQNRSHGDTIPFSSRKNTLLNIISRNSRSSALIWKDILTSAS